MAFKIFILKVNSQWNCSEAARTVNEFLEKHDVLKVESNITVEKVETWFACGSDATLTCTIEFNPQPQKRRG
jgi:predicted nucleotide-binding protein (sugar kinase/HSP70/actin superfamily)